jgi:hypothetical protein
VIGLVLIESSVLLAEILPEVGGKVGQIRHKPSHRDFLVPPQKPYRTIPHDGDWLQYDTSGMDDCFPYIAAGPYPDEAGTAMQLHDLGEWTHGRWEVVQVRQNEVVMARSGTVLPYSARKAVRFANESTLEFSYRVENRGKFPIRYMWSAHPLASVPGLYALKLPPGKLNFRLFPSDGKLHTWPFLVDTDLSRDWIPPGSSMKIFVTGLHEGWCELQLPEHTLRFTFDRSATPIVGIWFNNFGFPAGGNPFRCIAVEPCTSPSDLLDELDATAYPTIAAGGAAQWAMQLQVIPVERPEKYVASACRSNC